jgi:hypothetical protein
VSVTEDDFHLINNIRVWLNGCLIAPYYVRLSPDQIYTDEAPDKSRPPSGAGSLLPSVPPPKDHVDDIVNSVNNVGALGEGTSVSALS